MRCPTLSELPSPPGKAGWPFDTAPFGKLRAGSFDVAQGRQDRPWAKEGPQSERNRVFGKNPVSESRGATWP